MGIEPRPEEIADAAARAAAADATVLFLFDAHLYPSNRALLEALQARARRAGGRAAARPLRRRAARAGGARPDRVRLAGLPDGSGRRSPDPPVSRRPAQHLVVYEPFRSIFYAPQFVTLYGGHFAAEGFDVEVRTAGGGVTSAGALVDGTAKVSLGGVMRSLDLVDQRRATARALRGGEQPQRLLPAEPCSPRRAFPGPQLVGKTVLSFAEAPTPWQCMLTVLRRHGVDPATVRIERTLPVAEAVAAFRAGRGGLSRDGAAVRRDPAGGGRRPPGRSDGRGDRAAAVLVVHDDDGVSPHRARHAHPVHPRALPGPAVAGARLGRRGRGPHRAGLRGRRPRRSGWPWWLAIWPRTPGRPTRSSGSPATSTCSRSSSTAASSSTGHRYEDLIDTSIAQGVVSGG